MTAKTTTTEAESLDARIDMVNAEIKELYDIQTKIKKAQRELETLPAPCVIGPETPNYRQIARSIGLTILCERLSRLMSRLPDLESELMDLEMRYLS